MERNLGILKIILSLPTLFDQKITRPLDVSRIEIATNNNGTINTNKRKIAENKSNKRFISPTP
jgi:hypothetical protein